MDSDTEHVEERVNKRDYVSRVARRAGVPVRVASLVYEAAVDELLEIVGGGGRLTLTGLGKFYPQAHKGHRARTKFKEGDGGKEVEVEDYAVLKFSATSSVNKGIPIPPKPLKKDEQD